MFQNKQKEGTGSSHHHISLPKPANPNHKPESTRCISVTKTEHKPQQVNAPPILKPMAPPKSLTVPMDPFSTT
jgi:hypothetical protein